MTRRLVEDGMGFSGLVPTAAEKRQDRADAARAELMAIACAVADAYQSWEDAPEGPLADKAKFMLGNALRRLEGATRGSAHRKVRP